MSISQSLNVNTFIQCTSQLKQRRRRSNWNQSPRVFYEHHFTIDHSENYCHIVKTFPAREKRLMFRHRIEYTPAFFFLNLNRLSHKRFNVCVFLFEERVYELRTVGSTCTCICIYLHRKHYNLFRTNNNTPRI